MKKALFCILFVVIMSGCAYKIKTKYGDIDLFLTPVDIESMARLINKDKMEITWRGVEKKEIIYTTQSGQKILISRPE